MFGPMATAGVGGFWSYAHADDSAEGGRITQLARNLQEEYSLVTAQEIQLFLDRDDLTWGDNWRKHIDEALAGITFFIPILTPRYFQSEECRRELLTFTQRARRAGLSELLLPILYTDVQGLDSASDDEALAAVAEHQWEDWRTLRLEDSLSPSYRQGVNRLAARLVRISEEVATKPVGDDFAGADSSTRLLAEASRAIATATGEEPENRADPGGPDAEEPGVLDVLADAEAALPRWNDTMEAIASVIEEIGRLTNAATTRMEESDARGKGFAGRVVATRDLAKALDAPADQLLALGSSYGSDLLAVDAGFLALIDLIAKGVENDEEKEQAREFAKTIRDLAATSATTVSEMREFSDTLEANAGFSRDLRPALRKMQSAIRRITDGQSVIDEWARRINAIELD